jgi:hypothetical protein
VKPVVDTLPTVPTAPPAAGPDRAFDPPPAAAGPPAALAPGSAFPAAEEAVVAFVDVPRTTESAITAHVTTAATIQVTFFDSNRRSVCRRVGVGVALDSGGAGRVPCGLVSSYSFMTALL